MELSTFKNQITELATKCGFALLEPNGLVIFIYSTSNEGTAENS
jgi:hypothetical protein